MNILKGIADIKIFKFMIVGVLNTIIGTVIMFSLYNLIGLSYWISSTANYIVGSIISYLLNKYWTFQNKEKSIKIVLKFIVNILVCYILAYGIAKLLVHIVISQTSVTIKDNIAMIIGMILFTVFNYYGQKVFAFKISS